MRLAWIVGLALTISALVVLTEIASAARSIQSSPMRTAWIIGAIIAGLALCRPARLYGFLSASVATLREAPLTSSLIGASLTALVICAWNSPPNNYDSLTYHLPRVFYWAQQGSVSHFATANLRQIEFGPLNSFIFLNLFELTGNDHFFNLVQTVLLASVLLPAASYLLEFIGCSMSARRLGLLCIVGSPMLILQASSTQNDLLVTALLVASCALGCALSVNRSLVLAVALGATAGAAVLTKGTALIIGAPFAFWVLWRCTTTHRHRCLPYLLLSMVVAIALNAPHLKRNWDLSAAPFGHFGDSNRQPSMTLDGTASVLIKNFAVQLTMPDSEKSDWLQEKIIQFHRSILLLDINDERTNFAQLPFKIPHQWRKEDFAGNPIQVLIIVMTGAVVAISSLLRRLRREPIDVNGPWTGFGLALVAAFILFSATLNWQWWGSRLMLPLLVFGLIWAARHWNSLGNRYLELMAGLAIFGLSTPWLLLNETRPLLSSDSILRIAKDDQWFAAWPDKKPIFAAALNGLRQHSIRTLGFHFSTDVPEYPFLQALQREHLPPVSIYHVGVTNYSQKIVAADPIPPDYVLSNLTDAARLQLGEVGYERVWTDSSFSLYHHRDNLVHR